MWSVRRVQGKRGLDMEQCEDEPVNCEIVFKDTSMNEQVGAEHSYRSATTKR